jgi:hypothetical protein
MLNLGKNTFLLLILIMLSWVCLAAPKKEPPFKIIVVNKPQTITTGLAYKLTFQLVNRTSKELTLCLLPGFKNYNWTWQISAHTQGFNIHGAGPKGAIGTAYNPDTKEFYCKYYAYDKNDFLKLAPFGQAIIESEFETPKEGPRRFVTLTIHFESEYDGKELSLNSWQGKYPPLRIKFPIKQPKANDKKR